MRYDAIDVNKSERQTEGKLSERPLAELIREAIDAHLSGAFRLANGPARVVVYFSKGAFIFATSNLRAHRLREVIKRDSTLAQRITDLPSPKSDEEFAAVLVAQGAISPEALQEIRAEQAANVLRVALLWSDGFWSFDQRVRLANELRASIEIDRLLLESARHLPLAFVRSRVGAGAANYFVLNAETNGLTKTEAFIFSSIAEAGSGVSLADLPVKNVSTADSARAIYALCVAGFVRPADYHNVLSYDLKPPVPTAPIRTEKIIFGESDDDVNKLFNRLNSARTHYDVLDVARTATLSEIKNAYHALARQFHPDRFHQSDLRAKVESAFARIGRAYETLNDDKRRSEYDVTLAAKRAPQPSPPLAEPRPEAGNQEKKTNSDRAESAFQLGSEALERNQNESAIRYFAEAAMLEPRVARYRAYYGGALSRNPTSRRMAETELQAALKIEPDNASFRVMLAELYQLIGLRKRAESEAARALSADPKNKSARAVLARLSGK